ncbi:MAG: hypothetical protein JWM56_508 [Candidatus Peribacteria bacterium]|nr:hypothetical protein [Candidatus Peribacteria bacterium]
MDNSALEHREEVKILIKLQFKRVKWPKQIKIAPIQNKKYGTYLIIENIGDKPLLKAKITDIKINSAETTQLGHEITDQFFVSEINPNESIEIQIDKSFSTSLSGHVWVYLNINPIDQNQIIRCFQEKDGLPTANLWRNIIVIQNAHERQQRRTNFLLLLLTIITTIAAVFDIISFFKKSQ